MLLTADWVVPVSSPAFAEGAVLVVDGEIREVGPAAQLRARHPAEEARDLPGCALLPGFVNVHTHLDYSAFRGFSRSKRFSFWIFRLITVARRLDDKDLAASALWGAHECLRHGVTSIADASYGGSTVARAARAAGLRARVYLEVFGLDDGRLMTTMERLEASLDEAVRDSNVAAEGPVPEWGISPHAPYTVSEELYGAVAGFARRRGLHLATHVAESKAEVRLLARGRGLLALAYKLAHLWSGQRWRPPGVSPVAYVEGSGALGPDMLVVHAVQADGDDIARLAGSGSPVAHCPRSNLRLVGGVAQVAEMQVAGITVGLGTDSLASNDSLDMLAEMRTALEVSSHRGATTLTADTVLRMATLDGARALGWERLVGSLEVGKRADLVAVQLPQEPGGSLSADALSEAVLRGKVLLTMVDGKGAYDGEEPPAEVVSGLEAVRAKLGLTG